jgi:long-subunit acyl-CoA synthetase (AMP-forming)
MSILTQLAHWAECKPASPALVGLDTALDYAELLAEVRALADTLDATGMRVLALQLDTVPAWAVADLACLLADVCLVPLPPFFSPQQLQHCLRQSGAQAVLSDDPEGLLQIVPDLLEPTHQQLIVAGLSLALVRSKVAPAPLPEGVVKITYTSGTTGSPKGVMLQRSQIETVAAGLCRVVGAQAADRHLVLAPLAVLLENIGGLYVPLLAGARVALPGLAATGITGGAGVEMASMLKAISAFRPSSLILAPQLLQILVEAAATGSLAADQFRFIAVGGAPVSQRLLQRADELGLPVYQGYGLSECASVVTLNTASANRIGSVGRPLPHVRIAIDAGGEVLVEGGGFGGYLGETEPPAAGGAWRTGDLGYLDDEGYLYLLGRRRNVFITPMGRNVSPEWVERELILEPAIRQAMVVGEGRPCNLALITPAPGVDAAGIEQGIARVNRLLPDYARIAHHRVTDEPFSTANGQLSGTGRIRRDKVLATYAQVIEASYTQEKTG